MRPFYEKHDYTTALGVRCIDRELFWGLVWFRVNPWGVALTVGTERLIVIDISWARS